MADENERKQLMPIQCGLLPAHGPRSMRREFDFTSVASITFDMYKEDSDGDLSLFQAVFIENQDNANKLTIEQKEATRHKLVFPKLSQGIVPILSTKNPKLIISTTSAALVVVIHFLNVPLPYCVWSLA